MKIISCAHNATLTGDITIGEHASFWFNAVVRGDVAPVTIGKRVNVQDCAVVHCDTDVPNIIEDDVVIGHNATVHGMRVGRGSFIGSGRDGTLSRSTSVRNVSSQPAVSSPPASRSPTEWPSWAYPEKSSAPSNPKSSNT